MRWPYRLLMVFFGLYVIRYGMVNMERGHFAYENMKGQTVFAPGTIAIGVVLALLAFLPSGSERLYRKITTKRPPIDTTFHSHRERSAAHRAMKDNPSPQNHSE